MKSNIRLPIAFALALTIAVAGACSKKKETANEENASGQAAQVDPEAPSIVIAMIEAHGGMATWRSARTVSFEDEFKGAADSAGSVSRVMVDQEKRRAYIDTPATGEQIAWDGERAWSINWKQSYPPRFLALLNYYFLNLPWLTMDPGVKLATAGEDSLWDDPAKYKIVKMSFMPGTGDTPGDTYRLYIDPESKRLKACAYTVTYRALLPDSVDSMPEHILVYEDFATVEGLVVPTRYTIYSTDRTPLAICEIRDWSFDRPFNEKRMTMPDSAIVDESKP
jgi:hypothetical protein